ncbi:SOS response-associated peptidase [Pseudanabaena sp. PCC 6802]|uniref:SOS response-associated peptidase n=1 Tax=Pseudanabaena sp. PCC 6802 TaxID=118173 RepID=UPI0004756204
MCGRFSQYHSAREIAEAFQVDTDDDLPPRFNIAPSQTVAAIVRTPDAPQRQLRWLRWGLIPSWAKDPAIAYKLINARAETAAEKPSFRHAFKHRRCLIPSDGFYEWQRAEGSKSKKQPYYFSLKDSALFAYAGLWESWESPEGNIVETCTILTTHANDTVSPIHERMPVILNPDDYDLWLDPAIVYTDRLQALLKPYPAEATIAYPVSSKVNSPKIDSPECNQPLS